MFKHIIRKRSNLIFARNASARLVLLHSDQPKDYRALSVALSSEALRGPVGDMIVVRDRQTREAHARGERPLRYDGRLPRFDDLM